MTIQEIIAKYSFTEDRYYKVIDNEVYRNVVAGLIKESAPFNRATRKAGQYKVYAEHHNTQLPYTNYYIIVDDKVYKAETNFSILADLVDDLKSLK